jgi:hypothetical protein
MASDGVGCYLNKRTGEIVVITEEDQIAAEQDDDDAGDLPDWERESIALTREVLESDDYLALPDRFEIDEWRIMERFCLSLEDRTLSDTLLDRIRGSGAFRRFEDAIYRYKVANQWFRYRDQEFAEIAMRWLEANEIPFTNDIDDAKS